ncbi:hypothetical protein GCM10010282_08780 [Streptomyces roseolus]|nr:hypothetical protein GCM10010282_08780 [Streptomyces roseolus]
MDGETRSGWLITLDTVPTETPASRATSLIPTVRPAAGPPGEELLGGPAGAGAVET